MLEAAGKNSKDIAELLVRSGADVNAKTKVSVVSIPVFNNLESLACNVFNDFIVIGWSGKSFIYCIP